MILKEGKVEKILYIEDEKTVQEELSEVLENYCAQLLVADDGFQGLKLYKEHLPDIVITDIKMPQMDGIEMSKKIREICEEAPIIFTTAFSDIEYFQEAIELQVDGYILKPITLDSLERKINSIIQNLALKRELFDKEQMLLQTSKLASMGEMIGNIAHQWKQPLSVISMSTNNIKVSLELEGEVKEEKILECTKQVSEQIRFLARTIDDFRGFFQPHKKQEAYNLKKFLDKCISLVSASFDSNMIKTIRDIDTKINSYGDPNQLLQAIINILNNAKDALKSASDIQEKLVFIVTALEDDHENIVITIKDNAGGIPNNILPKIFEPYFTTKENNTGTGLGLYITHTIITQNLQGTITAQNEVYEHEGVEYKGSKFIITLPLAKQREA